MKKAARARIARALIALAGMAFLAACTGKPPEILRTSTQRIIVRDLKNGSTYEKLSVFMVGADQDGPDDLDLFYVINDEAELFWSVDSKTWASSTADGETWIGTNGIRMPSGAPLPLGAYRLILQDAGGDTAETSFEIQGTAIEASRVSFPSVVVKNGAIKTTGSFHTPEIWVYADDGRFLARLAADATAAPITLAGLGASYPEMKDAFAFWAYGRDESRNVGLLSGPYPASSLTGQ